MFRFLLQQAQQLHVNNGGTLRDTLFALFRNTGGKRPPAAADFFCAPKCHLHLTPSSGILVRTWSPNHGHKNKKQNKVWSMFDPNIRFGHPSQQQPIKFKQCFSTTHRIAKVMVNIRYRPAITADEPTAPEAGPGTRNFRECKIHAIGRIYRLAGLKGQ